MDNIFETYVYLVDQLSEHISQRSSELKNAESKNLDNDHTRQAREIMHAVLPAATTTTVGIFKNDLNLGQPEELLASGELAEAQTLIESLGSSDSIRPPCTEASKKLEKLAQTHLPGGYSSTQNLKPLEIIDRHPKNELDLLAGMLYEVSDISVHDIQKEVSALSYNQKLEIFETFYATKTREQLEVSSVLASSRYRLDVLGDFQTFRDLQRLHVINELSWQQLTPRYGYEVPKIVDEAGLTERFETCFDLSLKLHSELQRAGYLREAQYAALFGHRMRWSMTVNASEVLRLADIFSKSKPTSNLGKLFNDMFGKITEVHPLIAEMSKLN